MKSPVELTGLFSKFFCRITLLYHLIWRDSGQLANEAFTSNPIVSSKQRFNALKITNCFTFSYCLISVPLYTMLKALAFRSLYLVPNKIDFVFSWPKCTLNFTFLCWKTVQVSSPWSNESLTTAWGKSFT